MVQRTGLVKIANSLSPIDKVILIYGLTTGIWILAFFARIENPLMLIANRFGIFALIICITIWHSYRPSILSDFTRHIYGILLLSYWYGETYQLNHVLFIPFDNLFYQIDQWAFGYQPSIEFSKQFSNKWLSELLNFGYFSYFFLNLATFLIVFIKKREDAIRSVFIVLSSFFIYYWIFIIFPVIGPQFWLPETLRTVPDGFIFREGVKLVQLIGEQPTGAFPSSHCGMTIIFLVLTSKQSKLAFYIMLPISIILIFATVYIKAHYFVDVIAGLISGLLFYYLTSKIWNIFHPSDINNGVE
ncbi:MAG: phosphatase PAP2 family protein [Bacteroidota bacterium]